MMNKIILQYQVHQELTNKNSLTSTSENGNTSKPNNVQPNNPEQTLTQEQKVNQENLKRIMNSEKNYLTINKKHRLENS